MFVAGSFFSGPVAPDEFSMAEESVRGDILERIFVFRFALCA
jgi:hypothetical protein